ncbi:MAG: hypothetical protein LBQ12_08640 [Deltaproteobacteria bacterium]|nr:hypothetical protein [Deltaproteobacteria bacterium]
MPPDFSKDQLWDELAALDPQTVAMKSGASLGFKDGSPVYTVNFLGDPYALDASSRSAISPHGLPELYCQAKKGLLAYLVTSASGSAPGLAGKPITLAVPLGGSLGDYSCYRYYHELPASPLLEFFGFAPEEALDRAWSAIGAEKIFPSTWKVRVLPFVDFYWYLIHPTPWVDYFDLDEPPPPPDAYYSYDCNVSDYLPLDAVFGLANSLSFIAISRSGVRGAAEWIQDLQNIALRDSISGRYRKGKGRRNASRKRRG